MAYIAPRRPPGAVAYTLALTEASNPHRLGSTFMKGNDADAPSLPGPAKPDQGFPPAPR